MTKIKEITSLSKKEAVGLLRSEPTIQGWYNGVNANSDMGVAAGTWEKYLRDFRKFCEFLSCGPKSNLSMTLEGLVAEGKGAENPITTKNRITDFMKWLQGLPIPKYSPRSDKPCGKNNAINLGHGAIRSFFGYNYINFGKWKTPKKEPTKVSKSDDVIDLTPMNINTEISELNRDIMQNFLAELNLRDRAIFYCLLSTGQDIGTILKWTLGEIRIQDGEDRILMTGQREKTNVIYKCFITKEGTKELRRYIKKHRKEASNTEPVFVSVVSPHTRKNVRTRHGDETVTETVKVTGNLSPNMVSQAFKEAAERLGIRNGAGQCPLRPKRFRHIFRTMGEVAGIGTDTMGIFGGWETAMTKTYLSKSKGFLLPKYIDLEKLITIFDNPDDLVADEKLAGLKADNEELTERLDYLESRLEAFFGDTGELMTDLRQQIIEHPEGFTDEERERIRQTFDEE